MGNFTSISSRNLLFLMTVIIPTLCAFIYFLFIASDIYVSQMQITVKNSQQKQPIDPSLNSLIQGSGVSISSQDAYIVRDFIISRDALHAINTESAFLDAVSNSDIDWISRFNSSGFYGSFEDLFQFYQKHIDVLVDTQSSVLKISARAYTAADAKHMNDTLKQESENLINTLNERAKKDMLSFAEEQVGRAMQRSNEATVAVSNYRDETVMFDPEQQSALQLQLVSKIQDEIIATRAQLAQVQALTPKNPQISALKQKIKNLEDQESRETQKIVNRKGSFSGKSPTYEALVLEREFAKQHLAIAMASLEDAHETVKRKQIYLEVIESPGLPDRAMEPRRFRAILATFLLGLISWGILSILISGVKEHND